jgi:hypothetical protein
MVQENECLKHVKEIECLKQVKEIALHKRNYSNMPDCTESIKNFITTHQVDLKYVDKPGNNNIFTTLAINFGDNPDMMKFLLYECKYSFDPFKGYNIPLGSERWDAIAFLTSKRDTIRTSILEHLTSQKIIDEDASLVIEFKTGQYYVTRSDDISFLSNKKQSEQVTQTTSLDTIIVEQQNNELDQKVQLEFENNDLRNKLSSYETQILTIDTSLQENIVLCEQLEQTNLDLVQNNRDLQLIYTELLNQHNELSMKYENLQQSICHVTDEKDSCNRLSLRIIEEYVILHGECSENLL